MIQRTARNALARLAKWYPVVAVVGPRQSGKTTLVREVFSDYAYVNLEESTTRALAQADPAGFAASFGGKVVFDEAQNCPELFSQIQVLSDRDEIPGNFVISGSRNLALSKNIRQSLAGRVGVLRLLPLSIAEIDFIGQESDANEAMVRGGYPRLYNSRIAAGNFYRNYMETYVDKDVRMDLRESNIADYRRMVRACAQYAGQLVNYTDIARDIGISRLTAKSWVALLEESFICFELPAYFKNGMKRLAKTPKLYFHDTGLLCHLLKISSAQALARSPHRGRVFENFVVSETLKSYFNADENCDLCFYRDDSKREIDLVDASDPDAVALAEVKSTCTFTPRLMRNLRSVGDSLGVDASRRHLVMDGDVSATVDGMRVEGVRGWLASVGESMRDAASSSPRR